MSTAPRPDDVRLDTPLLLRRHLVAGGWTDRMIAAAVRGGELAKVRHGAYVDGAAWSSLGPTGRHTVRARAVLMQADRPLVLSHVSALAALAAPEWGLDLDAVDVTSRDGAAGRAEAGVRRHRGAIAEGDVVDLGGVPVTSPTRAALELCTTVGTEAAVVQVGDLLRRGLTTVPELATRYRASMERWPRSLTTDLVLRLVDGRCESVAESRFLFLCWRRNLPRPVPQIEVRDEAGRVVARLDFGWPALGVWVEIDGRAKYGRLLPEGRTAEQVLWEEKRREDLVRRLTGWRCVRLTWADLEQPEATALLLRRALYPGGVAA